MGTIWASHTGTKWILNFLNVRTKLHNVFKFIKLKLIKVYLNIQIKLC